MPVAGAKPKSGPVRHRVKPVHEWVEVPNVPFAGEVPVELPDGLLKQTHRWFGVICRMPHCSTWTESDWEFAAASALIADAFYRDPLKGEKALRDREKVMGTTLDYRRNIRVRYLEPAEVVPTEVASIDDYRRAAAVHQPPAD